MIEKISNENENNGILKFFSDKIHCLVSVISVTKEEDFLQSYKNSGIQIEEDKIIILDVGNLKKAKNIRVWRELSINNKKTPIVLTDTNFLITSKIHIIGISGINYIPVGIYYKDNSSEEIWSAGAIRLNTSKNDLTNLGYIFSIFAGIYGEGEIQVMIGPTTSTNKDIFESVKEKVENEIKTMENKVKEVKIYCCETKYEIDRDIKTIFYFNL